MPARGSIVILITHSFVRLITGPLRCWFLYFIFDPQGQEPDVDFPESTADPAVQTWCDTVRFCYFRTHIRQTRRLFIKNLVQLRVSTFVQRVAWYRPKYLTALGIVINVCSVWRIFYGLLSAISRSCEDWITFGDCIVLEKVGCIDWNVARSGRGNYSTISVTFLQALTRITQ